jgi:hypothetical protein
MRTRFLSLVLWVVALHGSACGDDSATGTGGTGPVAGVGAGMGAGASATGMSGASGGTTAGMGAGGASGAGAGMGGTAHMGPAPGADGAAFAAVAPMYAAAYCGVLTRCIPPAVIGLAFGGADCEATIMASLEDGELMDLQSSIDAGRVVFDPTKVDACFDMLDTVECTMQGSSLLEQGVCGEILTGTVAEGGDCGLSAECLGNTFCDKTAGCPGTCVAQHGAGHKCSDDDECMSPLSCDSETETCAASGQLDDACGGGVSPDCGLGFMCAGDDSDTMTAGTCKPIDQVFVGMNGDTCDFDTGQLCVDGLSCVVTITGMGASAMAEFACTPPVASGATCGFGIPSQCPAGEYCADVDPMGGDVEGTCTALPGDGAACAPQYGAQCSGDLVCDADNRCHPLGRIGDPCVSPLGCASGRCVADVCQRPAKCEVR